MYRYSDPTGVDQTCPLIDQVISFLNEIEWDEDEKDLEIDAKRMMQVMEMIRVANSKLRDFGQKQYDQVIDLEKDLSRANDKIEELEKELKWADKRIGSLEDTISDLETQLTEQQDQ